ncbi:MAG: tetratricopeptide repeat protein [Cyclobacteriaceae bacterium]
MPKRILLIFGLFLVFTSSSFGQRVKYKDLIELLKAKRFEEAEPFLKRYLKETNDNPNAFLYMGIIYHEKSLKADVLKHTALQQSFSDSALLFLDKAAKTITEREVKKDYYEAYTRRDMRTGEFGVKLSDIQLDIDTRQRSIRDRKEKVMNLRKHFDAAQQVYTRTQATYSAVTAGFGSTTDFYLQHTDATLKGFKLLEQQYDSLKQEFSSYRAVLQSLGKTAYNQSLDEDDIDNVVKDGRTPPDFFADQVKIWDYTGWAKQSSEVIQKEIIPVREHLVSNDIEINKLGEKLRKDSVSVRSDLSKLVDRMLMSVLAKYDPKPMPLSLFAMKMAELEFGSDLADHRTTRDSVNLVFGLWQTKKELHDLVRLDSLASIMSGYQFEADVANYQHFIAHAYGNSAVLQTYVRTTKEFSEREIKKRREVMSKMESTLSWVIDGTDSIAISPAAQRESRFKPLVIVPEKMVAGLVFKDTVATGFLYNITPSRIPGAKGSFAVDSTFKRRNLSVLKGIGATDALGQTYFAILYSEVPTGKVFRTTVCRVSTTGGLEWARNFSLELPPANATYFPESQELSIMLKSSAGEKRIVTLDKSGKRLP